MTTTENDTGDLSPAYARNSITPRDLQVALMTAEGVERNAIAADLGLSRSAVNRHMAKLFKLTGAVNGANLVFILSERGIFGTRGGGTQELVWPAAGIVREYLMAAPGGDVDMHVNEVIEMIAQDLERRL